jgi:hypothetical protein
MIDRETTAVQSFPMLYPQTPSPRILYYVVVYGMN